jgi:DNA repair protein endonuclease SAE2/CtIP C-terminus
MILDLAESITKVRTQSFVKELRDLRTRSALVDGLQEQNERLQTRIDVLLQDLEASRRAANISNGTTGVALPQPLSSSDKESGILAGNGRLKNAPGVAECSEGKGNARSPTVPDNQSVKESGAASSVEYRKLVRQHNTLVKYSKSLSSARDDLEKKLREVLMLGRNWMIYAQALEKKVSNLKTSLSSCGIPLDNDTRELSALRARAQPLPRRVPPEIGNLTCVGPAGIPLSPITPGLDGDTIVATPDGEREAPRSDPVNPLGELENGNCFQTLPEHSEKTITSLRSSYPGESHYSGSTQGDAASDKLADGGLIDKTRTFAETELSSDPPVFLCSRSVKRRRNGQAQGGSLPVEPKVKVEVITSSPAVLASLRNPEREESLDLDDIGEKYDTPKKKRRTPLQSDTNWTLNKPANQNDGYGSFRGRLSTPEEGEGAQLIPRTSALRPSSTNRHMLPCTSRNERHGKRRLDYSIRRVEHLFEDGENHLATDGISELDPGHRGTKSLLAEAPEKVARLTELLEQPSPQRSVALRQTSWPSGKASVARRRLPDNKENAPASSRQKVTNGGVDHKALGNSRNPGLKAKTRSTTGKRGSKTPEVNDSRSLRERPLQELSMEHFKVNPKYNQGYDFAFSDVVRRKQQRKCLPGCTRPECCGEKFRKFVEITGTPNGVQTESQEERDERLLEEYLGDNKGMRYTMSKAEREEALIRAKARELANKVGKHRHAYERRRSPPGFWRADFPDTQETKADRLEAAKLERELAQQRYEEAMRPGGRWVFRDE